MDFFVILLLGGTVIGSIYYSISLLKDSFGIKVSGAISTQRLEAGRNNEKAKIYDKKPVENPDVQNSNSNNALSSQSSGMPSTGMPSAGMPGAGAQGAGMSGGGVVGMVGVVNVLGAVAESASQISNAFIAKRQITGPIFQGANMIYNTKLNNLRKVIQRTSNSSNSTRGGRVLMKQSKVQQNRISDGKVKINTPAKADNYIFGDVRKIKNGQGNIYTKLLQIKGISKAQQLVAKTFVAAKGTTNKIQRLASGNSRRLNARNSGNQHSNIINNLNVAETQTIQNLNQNAQNINSIQQIGKQDINTLNSNMMQNRATENVIMLKRIAGYSEKNNERYIAASPEQQLSMIVMQNVYKDKSNGVLNFSQMRDMYAITRAQKGSIANFSNGIGDTDNEYKKELAREIIKINPHLTTKQKIQVLNRAMEMGNERMKNERANRQAIATERVNQKINVGERSREALDELLRETSSVANNFNSYIDDNYDKDIRLNSDQIKNIEQQARENIAEREGLSLQEKEEEFKKMKEELELSAIENRLGEVEKRVKEEILSDVDGAKEIIGEEGVELLKVKIAKIQEERKDMYEKIFQIQKRRSMDEYQKRKEELMKRDILKATSEVTGADSTTAPIPIGPYISRQARENEMERSNAV